MKLLLTRQSFNEVCTIGTLTFEDLEIFILEDQDRHLSQTDTLDHIKEVKVFGKTCIPYGTYEIAITFSNKFQKYLPILLNVPGFDSIRIHSGNTDADTEGCLLTGLQKDVVHNQVLQSRAAFALIFNLINERIKTEKIFIEIRK